MNQQFENRVLAGIILAFGFYVVLRAWLLPVTVDEATTAFNHVPRLVFDTLFFKSEANPNNHILNTLLIKFCTGIFGWHHFVLRIPVLLGAGMFAWASLFLVRKVSPSPFLRAFSLLLLFGNPYLLDFFSLSRGYGLAIGLMAVALCQGWIFLESNQSKSLRLAIVFGGLAVYANFTLILFFVPFFFLLAVSSWQMNPSWQAFWKQSKPGVTTFGIFGTLLAIPLKRLSEDSEIVHWNELGSFFESIQRTVRAAIYANVYQGNQSDLTLTWLAVTGAFAIGGIAIWQLWNKKCQFNADPRAFLAVLLFAAAATNVIQVYLTKTPYLESRLALFYWPLFALSVAVGTAWLHERHHPKKAWVIMAPILLILLINNMRTLNLHDSFEWYHDSDTFTVLEFLKKTSVAEGRTEPFSLETEWFMQNSFMYHLEKHSYGYEKYVKQVPFHYKRPPQRDTDFYYAVNFDTVKDVMDAYTVVLQFPNSGMILLRKK